MRSYVIPDAVEQEWGDPSKYCGIFQFRFWRFGKWIEVIIDDLLPTKDGKLLFAKSKTPNEFWSALLEKAFAKLYGCYENLVGGQLADALQDVSGGVAETINVQKFLAGETGDPRGRLFQTLRNAFDQQALIVAAIAAKNKEDVEKSLKCGLVKGHAYAVTAVRYIDLDAKERRASAKFFPTVERQMMIRLQNPWGEKEWNGPWSDGSAEWEQVTDAQKKRLGITVDEDGEFWMPWDQFVKYFTDISVCQLFNTMKFAASSSNGTSKSQPMKHYHEYIFYDKWTTNGVKSGAPKDRSGGCQNFAATFCFNPQYCFDIKEPNSEVMIALTQKDALAAHARQREPFVTIGIHVMRVECNRRHRIHQAISAVGTSDYASARSVYLHLNDLGVGRYVLMPTTYAPREQAEFMLRVYARHRINPRILVSDAPTPGMFKCSSIYSVTRVKIIEACMSALRDLNVYCVVIGEHERARSPTMRISSGTGKAAFNEMFVFHSNTLKQAYVFEIWEARSIKDRQLAKASLNIMTDNDCITCTIDMQSSHNTLAANHKGNTNASSDNSNGHVNVSKPIVGKLSLEVCSYDDPMYL
ncbi:calpain family cysteine protease domain-containing protein [Ditylenchus destructor]|uniref:Calpain family cysteine protease domain-containing protein n=1 Tax=Ditylenchus destructor TaxID=166010 RepID=A0AAD4MWH8_9BILA|nr:calpain family cysteine protease domain-containing protein [Ditylenchus destructor]